MSVNRHKGLPLLDEGCGFKAKCGGFKDSCKGHNIYVCNVFNNYAKEGSAKSDTEIGLLQMQILWLLGIKSTYGYELMRDLNAIKRTKITQGTLYPALQKLEEMKLIAGKMDDRKVVYHLTQHGRKVMEESCEDFVRTFYGIFRQFSGRLESDER